MELALAPEIVGRIFNGAGEPIDGLGSVYPEKFADVNGSAINPVSRAYPRNYIRTGISSIDTLITLIRGQKPVSYTHLLPGLRARVHVLLLRLLSAQTPRGRCV